MRERSRVGRAAALNPLIKAWFHMIFRGSCAALIGSMLVAGSTIGAIAAEGEPPKKKIDPLLDENTVHKLSVFSYMQPLERNMESQPILVTLSIKGPKGLSAFCEFRPTVHEAVLNIVTSDQLAVENGKIAVNSIQAQILEAVNEALPGEPVSSVGTRLGRAASDFGKDIVQTRRICIKLDG